MRAALLLIPLLACGRVSFDVLAPGDGGGDAVDAPVDSPGLRACVVSDIATGRDHTCMIESGSVWCWGLNTAGEVLPTTSEINLFSPVRVPLPSTAVQVSVGRSFTCSRVDTDDVYCWGDNTSGQFGVGDSAPYNTIKQVSLGAEKAHDLACGAYGCCIARDSDHAVECWGLNDYFAAGDPSGNPVLSPTLVAGTAGALALTVGHKHACVLDATGTPVCWGRNEYGQLGTSEGGARATVMPANITGPFTKIAAGGRSTCGIRDTGDVLCWGKNNEGELAITPTTSAHPTASPVVLTGAADIRMSTSGAIVARMDGTTESWGDATVGDGTEGTNIVPHPSVLTGVTRVVSGFWGSCALGSSGRVLCWGQNENGELGRGYRASTPSPAALSLTATSIVGTNHTMCAVVSDTEVRCWGSGTYGQLANGTLLGSRVPVSVPFGLASVQGVANGLYHVCAWNATTVRCWGFDQSGESSGTTTAIYRTTPATISGVTAPTMVVAGGEHTCAIDGTLVRCWGRNQSGQLGNNSTTNSATPVVVSGISNPTLLSSNGNSTCALAGGTLSCWGQNSNGQLGDGTATSPRTVPVTVALSSVSQVSVGGDHTCAVASGNVYCWGRNDVGQLGLGDMVDRHSPVQVTLPGPATTVIAADSGTCAILADTTVHCWGFGDYGQLGNGTNFGSISPVHIASLDGATQIARSRYGGCARFGTAISCWGETAILGNGDTSDLVPAPPAGCE